MAKFNAQSLIKESFARLFCILTFGIFCGGREAFSPRGEISREVFWSGHLLPSFYLFVLGSGLYRALCYFYGLFSFGFTSRKLIFSAMLAPAVYILFIGEMKRLRHIGLWAVWVVVNFYVPFGILTCGLICAFMPKIRLFGGKSLKKPRFLR